MGLKHNGVFVFIYSICWLKHLRSVMDVLSLTWQQGVGGGSVLSLSGLSSIIEGHRTVRPRPAAPSLLPSHRPPCCYHLTYSCTCLASPRLPHHCETLRAAADGSVFSGGWRWEGKSAEVDWWAGRRWQSLPLGFTFRVVKRVTIDLIICTT